MDAIPDMPGAMRLLRFLKEKKVPTALATSTSKEELTKKMKNSETGKKMLDYFDAICCGDEVKKGKPDPEIFHLARERPRREKTRRREMFGV